MALAKSGWLWRRSTFLNCWRRHWFDLWMDGTLVYSDDEMRRSQSDIISLSVSTTVTTGNECHDVQPPDGLPRGCLITVIPRGRSRQILCAETCDDAMAWWMSLLDVKNNAVIVYDPNDDYYQAVRLDDPNPLYGNRARGPRIAHMVIREDPFENAGTQLALGMLAGAVTGTAISSMMMLPCWF